VEDYVSDSETPIKVLPLSTISTTATIISAYVRSNKVELKALAGLIRTIHASLTDVGGTAPAAEKKPHLLAGKSVHADFLICLEDGKRMKMLKRHLKAWYNLTPDEYRTRWSLPPDYPMVAPNYTRQRSALAKETGLGRKKPVVIEEPKPEPAKRGRKKAVA
jgi:predicted transcriptional regulator